MKKHIPNTITCMNLFSGCISVTCAFYGDWIWALAWIMIGAAFDFCDGLAARLIGVSSPIGKELDSLADAVTFGVAPATIVYSFLKVAVASLGLQETLAALCQPLALLAEAVPFCAFFIAAFSALRLAKFNLDTRQTTSFFGLPTPANALFWGSLVVAFHSWFESTVAGLIAFLLIIAASCYLLVSELPMFAMKFKHWGLRDDDNLLKYGFLVFGATTFLTTVVAGIVKGSAPLALSSIAVIAVAYIAVSAIKCATAKE